MTTIYLIRHAEAEGNLYRIAQGQDNSNLTNRGWRQVRALERRFRDVEIDAVYASDLYRTCATASAVYRPKGLTLHRMAALREICVGKWERRTWGDVARCWPEQMEFFLRDPSRWNIEGAEDPRHAQKRVLQALREIAAENEGRTVAVFSHGYVIRLVLAALQGLPMERVGETPTGDNTAVSLLEAEGETLRVVARDDNSHLKTPEFLAEEKAPKRPNGLEPGLWFRPLRLPEEETLLETLVSEAWGAARPFDREKLLADARLRETVIGFRQEEPVGVVQLGPERGWISLCTMCPTYRKRGLGIQLIGQAVQKTREAGGEVLRVSLEASDSAGSFFRDDGFRETARERDRVILEKVIRFDPEFLGESGSAPRTPAAH